MIDTLLLFGIFAALAVNIGIAMGIFLFLRKLNRRLAQITEGKAVAAPPPRPSFVAELKKELRQAIGKVLE